MEAPTSPAFVRELAADAGSGRVRRDFMGASLAQRNRYYDKDTYRNGRRGASWGATNGRDESVPVIVLIGDRCNMGQCNACTVPVDGQRVLSFLILHATLTGARSPLLKDWRRAKNCIRCRPPSSSTMHFNAATLPQAESARRSPVAPPGLSEYAVSQQCSVVLSPVSVRHRRQGPPDLPATEPLVPKVRVIRLVTRARRRKKNPV